LRPILPPPALGLAAAGLAWGASQWFPGFSITFPGQQILAGLLLGTGLLIDGAGVLAFIRQKTTVNPLTPERAQKLVVSGLYRFSRNPMYLGMAFLIAAWSVYLGTPAVLVILPAFVLILNEIQIKPEEAALERLFGDEYRGYKQEVRRWL
jgi:protein-S-isoprenylcysteine O-methyltransferase Ste14